MAGYENTVTDVNNHLGNNDGCQFEEVKCSECSKMMERRYLTSHVETECPHRKVNCQYCHDSGEHQFIEGQHKEECPKFPLPCPNKCEVGSVPCEDMEAHRKECPLEVIQCKYHNVGCEVRMARKDQEEHKRKNVEEHLMKTNLALTNELNHTKDELNNTKTNLSDALKRIHALEALMQLAFTSSYRDARLWFARLVAMAGMSASNDQQCPVVLSLSEFNKQKTNNTVIYTVSFFTHYKGYKMCLKIYPTGHLDGKGTHLSLSLCLMKGPHDDQLLWPLRGKFEVKLLNQISDSHHHFMTMTFSDNVLNISASRVTEGDRAKTGQGYSRFISNGDLHKITTTCQYLKDDCLFFQVIKL